MQIINTHAQLDAFLATQPKIIQNVWFEDVQFADVQFADVRFVDVKFKDVAFKDVAFKDVQFADVRFYNCYSYKTPLRMFQWNQHQAVYIIPTRQLIIGCEDHLLEYWLEHYEEIGKANDYSAQEIAAYHQFMLLCKEGN